MSRLTMVGGGSWGTTLSVLLADKGHQSETPWVVVRDDPSAFNREDDVIVGRVASRVVGEIPELELLSASPASKGGGRSGWQLHSKPSAHAEMHHERLAARQMGDKVLGAPRQARDRLAANTLHEPLGKRLAQIRSPQHHIRDTFADEHRLEPATDDLDFGKLGQVRLRPRPNS